MNEVMNGVIVGRNNHAVPAGMRIGIKFVIWTGILIAVIAFGLSNYLRQFDEGLGVTGMDYPVYWGIYIVNTIFNVGLSAGGIIVACMVYAIGIKKYKPVGRIAEILAITTLFQAVMFLMLDLGRPDRFYFILQYARIESPLVWDVTIISTYMMIGLSIMYFSTRKDAVRLMDVFPRRRLLYQVLTLGYVDVSHKSLERDEKILKILAVAAIPAAVGLHSITAWIFGVVKAHPDFHSPLIAPFFVTSAIVSGLALVILVTVMSRHFLRLNIENKVITDLGGVLAMLIPVEGYLILSEVVTVVYGDEPAHTVVFNDLVSGNFMVEFWGLVTLLTVAFLILAFPKTRTVKGVALAALLVIIGVIGKRIIIVLPPLLHPILTYYPEGTYVPTQTELSITVGVYAVGMLIYTVISKVIPLVELDEEHTAAAH